MQRGKIEPETITEYHTSHSLLELLQSIVEGKETRPKREATAAAYHKANHLRVYVCGPYSHSTIDQRMKHVQTARECGIELFRMGHYPLIPHTMYEGLEHVEGLTWDMFMAADMQWLNACDAICLLPGWHNSKGACMEESQARALGLFVWEWHGAKVVPHGV